MGEKKFVVLGVTGGIAAYKAADLCSRLAKICEVQVIMTANARRFVSPLTFRTLSRNAVICDLWDDEGWRPRHVDLAEAADLFVVAPAGANFIAKLSCGIADDALSTFGATYNGQVLIAPAMNPQMWKHPACQDNIETLKKRGVRLVGPSSGHVACGADGTGRMAEPEEIVEQCVQLWA